MFTLVKKSIANILTNYFIATSMVIVMNNAERLYLVSFWENVHFELTLMSFHFIMVLHIRCRLKYLYDIRYVLLQIRNDIALHSSEIRGLRSTKCSSKTLQNLLYFMYKKTHLVFFVFHLVQLYFSPYECPGLCQHRLGHS